VTKQERFQQKQWGQIVARAWADPEFKARLMSDPQSVLREHGIEPEACVELRIVENSPGVQHIILPACPSGDMAEEELVPTTVGYCYCGYSHSCGRCGRCGCGCA
jgi:Nitrile hydratase, alpha chain